MKENGENHLVGIGKHYSRDFLWGIIIAAGIITLTKIFPSFGTIGLPPTQAVADNIGRFLIIVIVAPILEEAFFREFLLDFFDEKLVDSPFFIAALISSILFALFHLTTYGGNLSSASGDFLTAGVCGFGFAYMRKYFNSLTPSIVAHAGLNLFIGITTGVFVIVG